MIMIEGTAIDVRSRDANGILARAHTAGKRPACGCRTPPIPMYIAKHDDLFVVKRMPGSGSKHSPSCDSYEPPAELTGLGEVLGTAITEDPETSTTTLRLAFSMSKGAARNAPVPSDGETTTVKSDGTKLTLRSALHYLWDQAGFNRWTPAMEGKRGYGVVRKHLLLATEDKVAKNTQLRDMLYIPEPFSMEAKDEINQRARQLFRSIAGVKNGKRKLMIVVAEVKEFKDSTYGRKITFKHLPQTDFFLEAKFAKKLEEVFANEIELANADDRSHLMFVGTFSVSETGVANVEEAAMMLVSENWIPYENLQELDLLRSLTAGKRRFIKGLRFNLSNKKPLASVVLNDTTPDPVALYLVPGEAEDAYTDALSAVVESSKLSAWFWRGEDIMPALPAIDGYQTQVFATAAEPS
ncbi:DUF1173 domain-containing protein [Xanthomonas arboricola]|uniref:DUF1173 domain-containing protein n=1 Tax=Xanthomonas arboricola TaxID=56448 RepID=UPI00069CC477|nr:DUF1173 domain-containing protein [Xanthomonas arboricola]